MSESRKQPIPVALMEDALEWGRKYNPDDELSVSHGFDEDGNPRVEVRIATDNIHDTLRVSQPPALPGIVINYVSTLHE